LEGLGVRLDAAVAPAASSDDQSGVGTHGRFQRAIERRSLFHAELAAREMGNVNLADAFALALLIAETDPDRWPRGAARWHARFVLEAQGIGLDETALAL